MKSKSIKLPIISVFTILAIITACQPVVQLSPKSPLLQSEGTFSESATTIKGKVEFQTNSPLLLPSLTKRGVGGEFSSKASITDIATSATVALIYPSDHPTNPNVTIATGLTDSNGNFIINPSASFSPALNSVYVLEASKRIVSNGNAVLTVRTLIHWTGSRWDGITTPGIYINTKTTSLSIISGQRINDLPSLQTIGKMPVVNGITTISNITGTPITADMINKVEYLVKGVLNNNGDPVHYISYVNGGFDIINPSQINTGKIFTVAGGGSGEGEPAVSVGITPNGVSLDSAGNLYIADVGNNRIRKIDKTTGTISTVAGDGYKDGGGNGRYSGDGGQATSASLNKPYAISLDTTGNLYISDTYNNRIRKVDKSTGIITTVAGDGYADSSHYGRFTGDEGQATLASLNLPGRVAIDNNGNIFIPDIYNHRVRKVDKVTGIITTFLGDGTQSWYPSEVLIDSAGNLFIIDNAIIRKFSNLSGLTTVVGNGSFDYSGDGGPATSAGLFPSGIAFDSNENLYISDSFNNRVRKVDKVTGIITTVTGDGYKTSNSSYNSLGRFTGDSGMATSASLSKPTGIAIDTNRNIYIADWGNNRIRKVNNATGIISTFAGNGTQGASGDGGPATSAGFYNVSSVAMDNTENIYIASSKDNLIRKVDKVTGIISTVVGNGISAFSGDGGLAISASLSKPIGITLDINENIFIADSANHRIRKVDKATGIISTIAGDGYKKDSYFSDGRYSGDGGQATSASLNYPARVTVDTNGNIFIPDVWNNRIRKVSALTGIITTFSGNGINGFSGDGGQATSASLNYPARVTVDTNGNIFIPDVWNNRIRKVSALTGIITTFSGNGINGFSGDGGQATSASLNYPTGIAFDNIGNIFIADSGNHRIRKVDKATGIISTVAGDGYANSMWGRYSGDGVQATSASLNLPEGVLIDNIGNILIADSANHRIRKVDKVTGIISTIAGDGFTDSNHYGRYSWDGGQAESESLNFPVGLAIDNNGDIYIADLYNGRVRKIVQN